jgi:phosphoribosyl 1,2-cyclic phosphate phosphodiesterase
MKITILGSGGCQITPRPCCQCKICKEARKKGVPYERLGPSMFIEDENILFDTPEEISVELNRAKIKKVKHVLFSHWHPDHTAGMRLFEQINLDWFTGKGKEKIDLYLPERVYDDILSLKSKFGSYIKYWEQKRKLIKIHKLKNNKPTKIGSIKITPIKIDTIDKENSFLFLIEKNKEKVIYSICDFKKYPIKHKKIQNPNLLIIQNGYFEGKLRNNYVLSKNHELREELYSFQETMDIAKTIKAKKTLFMHIEELWGKSYSDYKKLEKKYKKNNIKFAFDGMKIKLK